MLFYQLTDTTCRPIAQSQIDLIFPVAMVKSKTASITGSILQARDRLHRCDKKVDPSVRPVFIC